jgi:predicted PhzF superfamily epimerase YddE/YHI9
MAVLSSIDEVRTLTPDFAALTALDRPALIVTAAGEKCDYVLRFFAPANGVPKDPVSGVAQCLLAPYWAKRLGKTRLIADQLSPRGGRPECTLSGDRVILAGQCAVVMRGTLDMPVG